MKRNRCNVLLFGMMILLYVGTGYVLYRSGIHQAGIADAGILAVMTIFLILAYRIGLVPIERVIFALGRMNRRMLEDSKDAEDDLWERYAKEKGLFQNLLLNQMFMDYTMEMERLEDGSCDIEAFINSDSLYDGCSRHYLDIVPGILASLGGLGTIGAAISMLAPLAETNGTAGSISAALIQGIPFLLYPLVYGVILTICYRLAYQSYRENLDKALRQFLNRFHQRVVPSQDSELAIQLKKVARIQSEGVDTLVKMFLDRMDASIGHYFEQLGENVNRLCETQEQSLNQIQYLMQELDVETKDMTEIHSKSEEIVAQLAQYTSQLESYQQAALRAFEDASGFVKLTEQMAGSQGDHLRELVRHEEQLNALLDGSYQKLDEQLAEISLQLNGTLNGIREIMENVPRMIGGTFDSMQEQLNHYLEAIGRLSRNGS